MTLVFSSILFIGCSKKADNNSLTPYEPPEQWLFFEILIKDSARGTNALSAGEKFSNRDTVFMQAFDSSGSTGNRLRIYKNSPTEDVLGDGFRYKKRSELYYRIYLNHQTVDTLKIAANADSIVTYTYQGKVIRQVGINALSSYGRARLELLK